jgi:SAM-dependent methyltransferase
VRIRYETWYGGEARPPVRYLRALWEAAQEDGVRSVCDIGGGANPLLSPEAVGAAGIERYVVLDVSPEELAKAPDRYEKVVADITRDDLGSLGRFDLVVSHAVAEHVVDPAAFHRAVYGLLGPGGRAMHYFPTFYDPVFLANRVLPDSLGERLLARFQKGREEEGNHGKFRAYYRWCRGPIPRQLRRLEALGYSVDEYVGVFGHGYFTPLPSLRRLGAGVARFLQRHPAPGLTAYAWVVLSRP